MKQRKILSTILLSSVLMTLVSCGSDNGGSNIGGTANPGRSEDELQDDHGVYRAVLMPLNKTVAGETTGTVEIKIEADDVMIESNITGAPAGVKHLQNITLSSACPDESSDTNKDSIIDALEAFSVTGPILIPLDSDISEQLNGLAYGPIANAAGNYSYRRSTTLSSLLGDLRSPDPDFADKLVKLPDGDDLRLGSKVILIHGVTYSASLPATVASYSDLPASQTLPIACARLVRISNEEVTSGSSVSVTTTELPEPQF